MPIQQQVVSVSHTTYQTASDVILTQESKDLTVVLLDVTAGHTAQASFDGVNDACSLLAVAYQWHRFKSRNTALKIWLKASATANVQVIAEQ